MSDDKQYLFWGTCGILLAIVAWVCRVRVSSRKKPSYEDLLERKKILADCVYSWKYPDGTLIPQHRRQQMFKQLHKVSRRIRTHPDNPDNQR